jgi:hypothetical protein
MTSASSTFSSSTAGIREIIEITRNRSVRSDKASPTEIESNVPDAKISRAASGLILVFHFVYLCGPLAHNNIDGGLLTDPQDTDRDRRTDGVRTQISKDLSRSRYVLTIPADDAVAENEARSGTRSLFVEMNDDGSSATLSVPQWMQLNADIASRDRAGLLQPGSDPFNGLNGNDDRPASRPKCSQPNESPGRVNNGAAVRATV